MAVSIPALWVEDQPHHNGLLLAHWTRMAPAGRSLRARELLFLPWAPLSLPPSATRSTAHGHNMAVRSLPSVVRYVP